MRVSLTPLEKDMKQRGVSDVGKGFEAKKTVRVQYQILQNGWNQSDVSRRASSGLCRNGR